MMSSGAGGRSGRAEGARVVALTQPRRGHGVSVTAYYLGRALVERGLRVLLVDLTGRQNRLHGLMDREPVKNLGVWTPPTTKPDALVSVIERARQETQGKVDVFVLDVDAALLQSMGGLEAGVDYITILVEPGEIGMRDADQLSVHFDDRPPPYGHVGVALCRTDASHPDSLPQQTSGHGLPVLGGFPADYLLANSDEYSVKGAEARSPHEDYLIAIRLLARALAEIVPLRRVSAPAAR